MKKRISNLTCNNNLGIIRFHVAIVRSCPLRLPLFLGFFSVERISVVFQDDQLGEEKLLANTKLQTLNITFTCRASWIEVL